jgi:ASF1 like histone chaperone
MPWLQANNPDPKQLPQGEVLGITAILLTCSYNTKARCAARLQSPTSASC